MVHFGTFSMCYTCYIQVVHILGTHIYLYQLVYQISTHHGVLKSRGYFFKMLSNDCRELFLIHSALFTAVFSINELT